jgi:energy-converting hydrogenase Eha subunit A
MGAMQMNTYFTVWHYGASIIISLLLIIAIIATLRQRNISAKISIIITYTIVAFGLLFLSILVIDTYTKKVTLSNLEDHRFYATEEIIFTGTVRNTGNYPIGEVSVEIKIVNKDSAAKEGEPAYQSNAFAELIGDKGLKEKRSFFTVTEVVATDLKPGQRKDFRIAMPHPSHFKGYTDYVRVFGN